MTKLPELVVSNDDGTVTLTNMTVKFFTTAKVPKNATKRQPIFQRMIPLETKASRSTRKKYCEEIFSCDSHILLKVFAPNTYFLAQSKRQGHGNQLLNDHVKEMAQFSIAKTRYLTWLKAQTPRDAE